MVPEPTRHAAPPVPPRPTCAVPGCASPAAKRYDRPGRFRRWCDRHCRATPRHATRKRGRPVEFPQPPDPLAPDARACPVPGCVRLRELRGRRLDGTPIFRWTCQAHRGAIPNRVTPPPPEPKPRTPWKPNPRADVQGLPLDALKKPPLEKDRIRYRARTPLAKTPVPKPVATITTAHDGSWPITRGDLALLIQSQGRPAFDVCTDPALSRPLPTSVVYRVWGMVERGELALEDA